LVYTCSTDGLDSDNVTKEHNENTIANGLLVAEWFRYQHQCSASRYINGSNSTSNNSNHSNNGNQSIL